MRTVFHTESSPGLGGQELRTLSEARWTAERGWRVLLAGQPDGRFLGQARAAGLEAVGVRMRGAWDLGAVCALQRLIRREQVSIVHTHSSVDGWVGGLAARAAGVPVVRTRHVSIPIRHRWNPVYRRLADRVITSGEAIRSLVIEAGVDPGRVTAIPAGVDLSEFTGGANDGQAMRESLGVARPVIGSVAMFRGSKGHAHLLDAFATVHARHPAARLLLVGDGIRRPWVEGLAKDRGLGEAVVFTGFRADVPKLLRAMDCFVLASTRTEGVPQSLLQAFAAGVPVVASAIGGIPEVVKDGETGILVPPGDAAALAHAIESVLSDGSSASDRARRARRLVEERFSHGAAVSRLLALYDEVIAGAAPRPMRP
ncbi:MAG: glycosyltransferase [Candidatus Rokubacteria bacterium]|nr:glycosyltransferase [Candidatus Rokubacteria bacterium]